MIYPSYTEMNMSRELMNRLFQCNKAKDWPCNNCVRRYPPVECVYTDARYATLLISEGLLKSSQDPINKTAGIG
jgi:hypothetical protein